MKYSLKDLISKITPPDTSQYRKFIPLYIREAQKGVNWEQWDKEIFESYFEKARNAVAYLGQGAFRPKHKQAIKDNWMKIAPHLKAIASSQDVPLWEEYREIKRLVIQCTKDNMQIATNRMMACLQPNLLCTEVDLKKVNELFDYIATYTDTEIPKYDRKNWESASYELLKLFHTILPGKDVAEYAYMPWMLLKLFRDMNKGKLPPHWLVSSNSQQNDYDEIEDNKDYFEGALKKVYVNRYERDKDAREECIKAHGCICSVCEMDFEKMYGELGKGFIHVHHIVPISTIGEEYKIDPDKDLVPVCPNCHAMLHRGQDGQVLSVEELKGIIKH